MKNKTSILYILLIILGIVILLYPMVSSKWNAYRDRLLINEYHQSIDQQSAKQKKAAWDAAVSYNKELGIQPVPDAFSLREGLNDKHYESLLNVHSDSMMGYVEIPKINVQLPIFHYTTDDVLAKGAGHLFGSALPVGGEGTHAVVSAHRGLPSADMFTNLDKLEKGDTFYYKVLGETLAYEVDQILVVKPSEVTSLTGVEGKDYSTLITCTPYGINTDRLLVRGKRIPYSKEVYKKAKANPAGVNQVHVGIQIILAISGVVLSFLLVTIFGWLAKKKQG
ncbi:class C sortase [Streptococcus cameli]